MSDNLYIKERRMKKLRRVEAKDLKSLGFPGLKKTAELKKHLRIDE